MQRCYAHLSCSLAVVVAVVNEERVFGFDASLLKGLYEDLRVGLSQMHGAREEDLIKIVVHAILMSFAVAITKEVVGTLVPMHKIGVGEQIDTMSAFAESEQRRLLLVRNARKQFVPRPDDVFVGHITLADATHLSTKLLRGDVSHLGSKEQVFDPMFAHIERDLLKAYLLKRRYATLVVQTYEYAPEVEDNILFRFYIHISFFQTAHVWILEAQRLKLKQRKPSVKTTKASYPFIMLFSKAFLFLSNLSQVHNKHIFN